MLSICIPIYNYDVTALVNDLHKQGQSLSVNFEILLIDDYSSISAIKEKNQCLGRLDNVNYHALSENIGRAAIRNLLAQRAKYRYLVFMDCDAGIFKEDYLKNYLAICTPNIVCYGGRRYPEFLNRRSNLRVLYGLERENTTAKTRNQTPHISFITFNFLIDKAILQSVGFNENITSYGHEDTLFAIELERRGIQVLHIDNELLHTEEEDSDNFIKKTENSILNLLAIQNDLDDDGRFSESVKLLRTHQILDKFFLNSISAAFFRIFKNGLLANLKGNKPKLFYFDLYKLGYLCEQVKNKTH